MEAGDLISRKYRLVQRLAEGGMGEVWLARNERTQRDFAVKVLLPSLASNAEAMRRFVQEARATGRVQHPSLVEVFDAGKTADNRPYLVMELLSGESLAERLIQVGRLRALEACVILSQIAGAMAHAHAAGIVHRDLSTSNVFLARTASGVEIPKIIDFGVSKILDGIGADTLNGSLLGSPAYMAPEQAEGAETVDHRADVWSMGVLLYQCLAGKVPYNGRHHNATMIAVLTKQHRPLLEVAPRVDPELASVVEACLVKDRDRRLASAAELADRLRTIALRLSAGDARLTPRRRATDRLHERPAKRERRLAGWFALPAAALFSALTGFVGSVLGFAAGTWFSGVPQGGPALDQPAAHALAPPPTAAPVASPPKRLRPTAPSEPTAPPRQAPAAPPPGAAEGGLAGAVAEGLGVEARDSRLALARGAARAEAARGARDPQ